MLSTRRLRDYEPSDGPSFEALVATNKYKIWNNKIKYKWHIHYKVCVQRGAVDRISISWQTYLNINTHEAQCWDTDHNSQHAWQIPLQSYLLLRMRMRWMEFILANLSSSIFANSSASNYIYCRICLLLFILVKASKF